MIAPRSVLLVTMVLAVLAPRFAGCAQAGEKAYRIGILCPVTCDVPPLRALRQGLLERGYIDGGNIAFEHRAAGGKFERFPDLFAEMVALQVDVIVATGGLPGALAAQRATATIPVVFVGLGEDPIRYGLVQSLARPGGNVTGLVALYAALVEKQLEFITTTVPGVSRVGALWDVGVEQALEPSFTSLERAAKALGVQPHLVAVRGPDDFARAFRAAADARVEGLILLPSPTFLWGRVQMANLAADYQFPAISPFVEFAQAGGLMAYGPNVTRLFRYAAGMVDRILKGAKPADLPVEQPVEFTFVINLKTAETLRLTIPPTVLLQANEVIR